MKSFWLKKKNNEKVLLFFAGWGMDPNPFLNIESGIYDIVMLYDYRNISCFDKSEIDEILNNYNDSDLLAWSMGVWSANYLLKDYDRNKFTNIIALNGTLLPIDDNYGIPNKIYQLTIDNFSAAGRRSFNKRMCVDAGTFSEFEKSLPDRSDEELKEELIDLQANISYYLLEQSIFTKALISNNDKIIPTENQIRFWKDKIGYGMLEGPHFMFYKWKYWEDIVFDAAKS